MCKKRSFKQVVEEQLQSNYPWVGRDAHGEIILKRRRRPEEVLLDLVGEVTKWDLNGFRERPSKKRKRMRGSTSRSIRYWGQLGY